MRVGFAREDLTPRVGVELCGFGPYLHRYAIGVRDRLWARAIAIEQDGQALVLVSCDLIGVGLALTRKVRELVAAESPLPAEAVMVHCTHTHSGPASDRIVGWGVPDEPYLEVLPYRIARACLGALAALTEASLSHARVPCQGVARNREYDPDVPSLEQALREDWRPSRPELTDTACDVLRVDAGGKLLGFASSFGCHPVVCCEQTRYLHGDFVGVATGSLEKEHPGAVGLFLQGAQGDINTCVAHQPEPESLQALDVIAARYARALRAGLEQAQPLAVEAVRCARREVTFDRVPLDAEQLQAWLAEQEAIFAAPGAGDHDMQVRMAAVCAHTLRALLARLQAGAPIALPTELHGFRLGPLALLGTPLEVFRAVKEEVLAQARSPLPLVLGLTNDALGYAPDRETATRGGYAAQQVPIMMGSLPFRDIHGQLVSELLALEAQLW
jgi:hypothetical protein